MDGSANWTEIGRTGGRDPLGMLSAVEYSYQTLLPGMSTVTERLRYYSFHCWWIKKYADLSPTTSALAYGDFARRFEFLYVLASLYDPSNPGRTSGELGLSGAIVASKMIKESENVFNFQYVTSRDTPSENRYMQPAMGDFINTYAPQMREIGLLHRPEEHGLNVPTATGLQIAEKFEHSLGAVADLFVQTAQEGCVDRATLEALSICGPGAIPPDGEEANMLRDLLMGRLEVNPDDVSEYRRDEAIRVLKAAEARRDTLLLILDTAQANPSEEVSQEMLRWKWFETPVTDGHPRAYAHARWQYYQAGDTARVTCEALLDHAVDEISRGSRDLPTLLMDLTHPLAKIGSLEDWLVTIEARQSEVTMQEIQARTLDAAVELDDLMSPLARLYFEWADREEELADAFPSGNGRQSVRNLLQWMKRNAQRDARSAMIDFFRDFILLRHLAVAAGKFRANRAYTYLFELHEHELHWKQSKSANPSGPRLRTAVRFLEDLSLLEEGSITERGRELLDEAAQ